MSEEGDSFLWDDFEADAELYSGPRRDGCSAGRLIATFNEDGQAVIQNALDREDLTTPAILKAIKMRVETNLSSYTLRRHRRGDCSCHKE